MNADALPPLDRGAMLAVAVRLSALIGLLASLASVAGLAVIDNSRAFEHTTARGQTVELYGRGLYRYESLFGAGGNQGSDLLTLLVAVPLLAIAARLALAGSLRGRLLLCGALVYFLYVYATRSLGSAYNDLFLVYTLLFAASLCGFMAAFAGVDQAELAGRLPPEAPRRLAGVFMLASAALTLAVWLMEPLAALIEGRPPARMAPGVTLFTNALDIAVIVPAAAFAGVLILRGRPLGYLAAVSLLVLEVMLAPMIALQTAFQLNAGESFTAGEIIGPITGFAVIAAAALLVLVRVLRAVR